MVAAPPNAASGRAEFKPWRVPNNAATSRVTVTRRYTVRRWEYDTLTHRRRHPFFLTRLDMRL